MVLWMLNRVTILGKRDTFQLAGHVFRIRLVVPWVVRTKRVTILTVEDYYISVSLQILKESLKREKLGLQRR